MLVASSAALVLVVVPGAQAGAKTKASSSSGKDYISVGDSYSVGYQPAVGGGTGTATAGYTAYVAGKLKMQLVNYGCGGATTASLLSFTGVCGSPDSYGPPAATDAGVIPSGDSQITAAVAFIEANPGKVGLVTISIGGNDVTPCAAASPTNPVNGATTAIGCVAAGLTAIEANIGTEVSDIHSALISSGDSSAQLIGLTYPDVLLGLWVYPALDAGNALAEESILAFEGAGSVFEGINPALKSAYTAVSDGKFVDITKATGAYTPLSKLAKLKPAVEATMPWLHGVVKVPKAVAEVCTLTYYCEYGNIHANTLGYTDIGKQIVKAYKK
jgi:hypothetical protein